MAERDSVYEVIVIGGGPVGLGLAIAVPCYLFYIHFVGRSQRLLHRIERAGIEIVNIICDAREGITSHLALVEDEETDKNVSEKKKS